MKKNKPKVLKTVQKRIMFLCAKFFELIEKTKPDILKEEGWQKTRTQMLDLCNDIVRANTEDLEDASLTFRPLVVSFDRNKVTCSAILLNILRSMEFVADPLILTIESDSKNKYLLESVMEELGMGSVDFQNDRLKYVYTVCGNDCKVLLVVLDKIVMTREVREKYLEWREKVVHYGD